MVLAHVQLAVSSHSDSKKFYLAALAPLGYKETYAVEGVVAGLSADSVPDLWLRSLKGSGNFPTKGLHLAFKVENREVVDKFYEAAIATGAKDNGRPGGREYFPGYYSAFVFDPEGNNIEAVHL